MKKIISLFLSIVMLISTIACVDLSAYASDVNIAVKGVNTKFSSVWNSITGGLTNFTDNFADFIEIIKPIALAVTTYTSGDYTYTLDDKGNATITSYSGFSSNLIIPSNLDGHTVISLESNIMSGNSFVVSITIPKTVTSVGYNSFQGRGPLSNSVIETVIFESGITKIPDNICNNCPKVTSVTIPNSVTEIGSSAFANCTNLKNISIPNSVTKIGGAAFANAPLISISLPSGLTYIGDQVFGGNNNITSITIPKTVTSVGYNSFQGRGPLSNSVIETVIFESGITKIPDNICNNCPKVTSVTIPNSVTEIGGSAFANCTNLKNISIPNSVTKIGSTAFINAPLTSISLPSGLTYIGDQVFGGNTIITSITIPKTVTSVGFNSWQGNGPLSNSAIETVIFESGITKIPDNICNNCPKVTSVTIPNSVIEISGSAFANCTSLSDFTLPDNLTKCASNAFNNCNPNLKLSCGKYTPAMKFAIDNDFDVSILNDKYDDSATKPIIKAQSDYYVNADAALANGYVKMTVKYALKSSLYDKYTDKKIVVKLPKNTELVENSTQLDGNRISYTYNDNNELTVNVTQQSGTITYCIYPTSDAQLKSYATVQYKSDDGKKYYTIFGVVVEDVPMISIESPERVSTDSVSVTGVAPKGQTVSISVDGENIVSTKASQSGKYTATVPLNESYNYKEYTITASTPSLIQAYDAESSTDEISATTKVQYNTKTPVAYEFTMEYNDDWGRQKIDLLDPSTPSKTLYYWPKYIPAFLIKFDNGQSIDKVYIVSTRNGVKKYLEAEWNAGLGGYYASGYFDPDNATTYVPGTISYEYTTKTDKVEVSTEFDFANSVVVQGVSDIADNVTVSETKNENGDVTYSYVFDDELGDLANKEVDLIMESYSETYSDFVDYKKDYENVIQYFSKNGEGKEFGINIDFTDPENIVTFIHDVSSSKTIKTVIEFGDDSYGAISFINDMSAVSKITGLLCDNYEIIKDDEKLREQINASNMSYEEKQKALEQASELKVDRQNFVAISALLGLAAATLGTGGMAAPALLFTLMLGSITSLSGFVYDYRMNSILGGSVKLKWIIDPSGYVFEATPTNRIEGVKCTIYYKETENSSPILWDASEYEQENPLYTNSEGKYAWDVPEGLWQVKYEKAGYTTTYSEWMEVPPPQTDVNISMVSTTSPEVEHVNYYNNYIDVWFNQYMNESTLTSNTISLTDNSGKTIPFTIEYVDDVPSILNSSVTITKELLIIPDSELNINENYRLSINSNAKSYADLSLISYSSSNTVTEIPTISLLDNSLYLSSGNSKDITVTVENISNGTILCTSSNENVATVNGKASLENGIATITVSCHNSGYAIINICLENSNISTDLYVSCDEENPSEIIVLEHDSIILNTKSQYTINPTLYPLEKAQSFLYESNNNAVATVNSDGIITAVSDGTAIITIENADSSAYSEMTVTVVTKVCNHKYTYSVVAPTCTVKGYTIYTCECGDSYIDNYVSATGHNYNSGKVTKTATCTATGVKTYTCTKCGATKTETIPKTAHTYKSYVTKATTSKNGSVVTKCTVCGYVSKTTSIPYVKTVTLSTTSYTYDGKVKKPSVTVKDNKGNKIASSNYIVTYQSGRKNVGKYSVKITFKGNYSGTKTLYFTINPKGTSISSVTAKSKGFTVKWKKQSTQTTGYQIQYSTSSKFTNAKTVTVSKNSTTSKTISKLSAKKKYYIRVRTYKTVKVNGKSTKIYSSWSKAKYVTTKR